jgi:POT family proton-dependent oligopeptide transporter
MTIMAGADQEKGFLGHPRGLAYLVFAEAWERFSYYGMLSLLALYMSQQLFLPGHIQAIAGFGAFRHFLESVFGPKTPVALALLITGLYSGGVYVTPIAGGYLADRVLGRTRTVVVGALLMALGHFLMAFEVSFLAAMACLLIGVGCFKGNIATQVGELYAVDDPRRADAFQIFLLGINAAVIVSPLICGTLGQKVAWHWGFGAAGIGMLVGLVVYLSGRQWLPPDALRPSRADRGAKGLARTKLTADELKTVGILVLLLPVLAVAGVGNQQIFGAYIVWGNANYDLVFFGQSMPATWLLSIDAIVSAAAIVATVGFWRWWATRRREPQEITKLAIGALIAAFAPLALSAASAQEALTGHKVGLAWGLAFHIINDIGYANIFPVGLALYSRAAPKPLIGMIIGVYYLNLFGGNTLAGWLGGLLEPLGAANFWTLHAALVFGGAVALFVAGVVFRNHLAPVAQAPATQPLKDVDENELHSLHSSRVWVGDRGDEV